MRVLERRPVNSISFKTGRPLKSYIIGFIVGLCTITAVTAILVFTGVVELQYRQVEYEYSYMIINIGIIALGWIVQSASEEMAIRGWLIPHLGSHGNPIVAIAITAIIFGMLHLFSSGVTVLSFLNLTLSGIFCWLYYC